MSNDLEKQVVDLARTALNDSMVKCLTSYQGPLQKIVEASIGAHASELRKVADETLESVIRDPEFIEVLRAETRQKMAKALVAGLGGSYERIINEFKQDPISRSKITLALDSLIKELSK